MPSQNIKVAIADMFEGLSRSNFDDFCHELLHRKEGPRVARIRVEGKSYLEITDVLVSTFTESRAVGVAEEILREIGCNEEAEKLKGHIHKNVGGAGPLIESETQLEDIKHLLLTMAQMDKRRAVKRMLANLSKKNFDSFLDELVHRKAEPRVARNRVEGKDHLEITDVLISTFDETGAVKVAAELLNEIECKKEATQLLADTGVEKFSEPGSSNTVEATGGPSSDNGSRDSVHFVDKHRIELINRVCCVDDILDKLLDENLINQAIYDEILEIKPTQKQMRKIFTGPLKAAGLRGKEVFYKIIEEMEPYLIEDLKGKECPSEFAELFVDKHQTALVWRVKNIAPILDGLHSYEIINSGNYEEIKSLHGPLEKMKALLSGPLRFCEPEEKEIFYKLLRKHESHLIDDLADESEKHKKIEKDMEEVSGASMEEKLLETLEDLSDGELEKFKRGLQRISYQRLKMAGRANIAYLMVEIYGQQCIELTTDILKKMKEDDYGLEQRLTYITLGSKGPSRSLDLEGSEKMMPDSSGWTKLEPEMKRTDEDAASTYSLKSEAGTFECSVSGLRWVCQEKVSFKYQFCSWEEHMDRMERMKYMPAGPLIDITVIAGKLFEVYLPHWICIDDIPKIRQKFAVLHIDDCGDVVEKVSVITSSHVKLSEPVFSPRAVLMKMGFPVKIHCYMLIYSKPDTTCILLHVYLIPLDPALKETMDKKKKNFKLIQKPRPDKYLKMQQGFNLTADITTAKICPEEITLRYDSQDPNFYEVYIENPDSNFHLTLSQLNKGKCKPRCEPVWTCEIRKGDLRNSGDSDVKETGGQTSTTDPCDVEWSSDEMQGETSVTTRKERLLKMLKDLGKEDFKAFKWFLLNIHFPPDLSSIPYSELENSDMFDLVNLMSQTYDQDCLELTKMIFKDINRNDLVQKWSGSKGQL
ncbi:apoptosis-associated speck-like protein containing a CARD [Eleginops maclovinus]|uniref:apoptosis-associated speck-like protein containing a CARD n=1 Tax=Eleginops maclovinus TaxID=56733 RepID=UPI003080FA43